MYYLQYGESETPLNSERLNTMFNLTALKSAAGRMTGQTEILEGYFAGGLWAAAADGHISRDEALSIKTSAMADPLLTKLFNPADMERIFASLSAKLKAAGDFAEACRKELIDIAGKPDEVRHAVYLAVYKVTAADGNVDDDEREVLGKVADALNILKEDAGDIENTVKGGVTFDDW